MTRRCGGISSSPPLASLALLLLLCLSHCAAAARLFPADTAPHQDIGVINVEAADAASDGLVALHVEGANVGNGEEAVPEVVTAEAEVEEEEEACGEGSDGEECMQRRLLHDAHLDYIYTQRKGRP